MKITGVVFIIAGIFWAIAGFAMYASDIQLGIALTGVCMAGIGGVMIGLSNIKNDLLNFLAVGEEVRRRKELSEVKK